MVTIDREAPNGNWRAVANTVARLRGMFMPVPIKQVDKTISPEQGASAMLTGRTTQGNQQDAH
jgi:hypothetical protein